MFHKVKNVNALPDHKLCVQFSEGITKIYNAELLMDRFEPFKALEDVDLFNSVKVDIGGNGISWNDEIDISCDELFDHGTEI